jgi:hypothetical protein
MANPKGNTDLYGNSILARELDDIVYDKAPLPIIAPKSNSLTLDTKLASLRNKNILQPVKT